jgi:hypothetical protein
MDGTCRFLIPIPMAAPSRGHYTSDCPILSPLRSGKFQGNTSQAWDLG